MFLASQETTKTIAHLPRSSNKKSGRTRCAREEGKKPNLLAKDCENIERPERSGRRRYQAACLELL